VAASIIPLVNVFLREAIQVDEARLVVRVLLHVDVNQIMGL